MARLKGIFTGQIKTLGTGVGMKLGRKGATKTTLLAIGTHQLKGITYSDYMLNFLARAFDRRSTVTIVVYDGMVTAINDGEDLIDDSEVQEIVWGELLAVGWIVGLFTCFIPIVWLLTIWATVFPLRKQRKEWKALIAQAFAVQHPKMEQE